MAKDALERLERTVLFETLQTREDETRTGHEISERVRAVVGHVAPLLERVPEKMPEFTLHDPNHGAKVVALMAQFLPADTLARLNVVELSILIYAAYLHDLGMTCSTDEREEAVRGDAEFARQLAADETRSLRLQRLKEEGDHRAATAVEDQVFTEYLRRTHVRRSARFIEETLSGEEESALAISWQGTPYSRWVRTVCDSHELPVSRLRDTKTWPRDALVRNLRVNVQYLSLVLRLADILDLDPERTPKVLLDFINPKDPTSVREWHKHRSVIGWEITPERIRFEAECTHPVYERALREFLDWIEVERQDSVLLASSYRDELSGVYRFDLTEPVTKDRVRSDGTYIYSDLKFNIDYQRVLNLLMGERLYGSPVVALRELLQNSVDAVRLRQALCERDGEPFEPHIAVKLEGDTLVVEDNGVGMDEHIVKNYFMQVGRSYYRSAEFRARQLDIDPVSEFGIGILSVFMVAHACEVESRRHPDDPLNPQPPVRIEIPTAYDYFVQRHTDRTHIGTTIKLFLKPGHPFKSDELLQRISGIAPFIEYPVVVETDGTRDTYRPRKAGEFMPGTDNLKPGENSDVKRFFPISLEDSGDPRLSGIKGGVYVTGGITKGLGYGIIAQRGFAIGYNTGRILDLIPYWTSAEMS
ncbi:MAG: ATP-binding protein, partial [Acidobacteriota bacterium]|nr:ATP-binding protein [Acidobacteriota bacterium]